MERLETAEQSERADVTARLFICGNRAASNGTVLSSGRPIGVFS